MKHCSVCQKDFDDTWTVCVKCGGSLEAGGGAAPVAGNVAVSERESLSAINADYLKKASRRLKRDFIAYLVLSVLVWVFVVAAAATAKVFAPVAASFGISAAVAFLISTLLGFVIPFRLAFVRNALRDSVALHLLLAIFVPFGIAIIPVFAILSAKERLLQIEKEGVIADAAVPRLGFGSKAILCASLFIAAFTFLMIIAAIAVPVLVAASKAASPASSSSAGEKAPDEDRSLESYYKEFGIEK